MNETPLDGYKKISVTVLSALLSVILLFVKDPANARTLEQFWSGVLTPLVPAVIGIIYTAVQGSIDREKVKASAGIAPSSETSASPAVPSSETTASPAVASSETSASPVTALPASSSGASVADPVDAADYVPVDCDVCLSKAEEAIRKDGLQVTPLNRAYYFWPYAVNFDLRPVPRQLRVDESRKLMNKCLELFTAAFTSYTGLSKVPAPAQASNIHTYMLTLKKDYEKANNLACSDRSFDELKNMVGYFHDIYTVLEGLDQLAGKTVDWSVYGSSAFTPTQIGWDFARLV